MIPTGEVGNVKIFHCATQLQSLLLHLFISKVGKYLIEEDFFRPFKRPSVRFQQNCHEIWPGNDHPGPFGDFGVTLSLNFIQNQIVQWSDHCPFQPASIQKTTKCQVFLNFFLMKWKRLSSILIWNISMHKVHQLLVQQQNVCMNSQPARVTFSASSGKGPIRVGTSDTSGFSLASSNSSRLVKSLLRWVSLPGGFFNLWTLTCYW